MVSGTSESLVVQPAKTNHPLSLNLIVGASRLDFLDLIDPRASGSGKRFCDPPPAYSSSLDPTRTKSLSGGLEHKMSIMG